ncbi:hypothetical protein AAE02nite_46910 [Adhaeribacter aerolatus]|uniref:Uncharacterized protein n=2 Tax=Adhaeribacter aerolatus TaxID=670289 RepID=A0A512B5H5_9BACT|nr:hypothetical protein AAE02nite_46910 [Adhaeribacter aerolatus]
MPADTVPRSPFGNNNLQQQFSDKAHLFRQGMAYMEQDSVEKGINVMATALKLVQEEKKLLQTGNYHVLELISFFDLLHKNQLSPSEKALGSAFLEAIFVTRDKSIQKKIATYIKRNPGSVFTNRLKVYTLSYSPGKALNAALAKLLTLDSLLVNANVLQAEQFFNQQQYAPGIKHLSRVIRLAPAYAYAYNLRGYGYYHLNQPEKAIVDYNQTIRLYPQFAPAFKNLGDVYYDSDQYQQALASFKQLSGLNPEAALYDLALCFKALKQPDSALYYVEKAIARKPDDAWAYNLKGDLNYGKDKYSLAIQDYSQAIALDPKERAFYVDRADAYYYAGTLDYAIEDFMQAYRLNNKKEYVIKRLGDCYYDLRQYEKAIAYCQEALQLDPEYLSAYMRLALSYTRRQQHTLAEQTYQRALKIDSTYAGALGNLGWTYYCTDEFKKCIDYSYQALKYEPDATYAMFNIALATLRLGEFEKAKALYSQFIQLCKKSGYVIEEGARADLQELVTKGIQVQEARYIIDNFFSEKP